MLDHDVSVETIRLAENRGTGQCWPTDFLETNLMCIYVYIGYSGNSNTDICDKSRVLTVLMFGDASVWYDSKSLNFTQATRFSTVHTLFQLQHVLVHGFVLGKRKEKKPGFSVTKLS